MAFEQNTCHQHVTWSRVYVETTAHIPSHVSLTPRRYAKHRKIRFSMHGE